MKFGSKKSKLSRDELDFLDEESRALLTDTPKGSSALLYATLILFALLILWAYFAKIDERTVANGKVIPSSQIQVIQNLEGGILAELYVKEGDLVRKGQKLLRINDTRFSASYQENREKYVDLMATISRLQAEASGAKSISFPEDLIKNYPKIVKIETRLFNSRQARLKASITSLEKSIEFANKEFKIMAPLAKEGLVPKVDVIRLQQKISELEGKLAVESETFQSKVREELSNEQAELASLTKALMGLKDKMVRTLIRSPVDGIVKKVNIATIGGIIKPGADIMEVVPIKDTLLIEAKVRPQDIAFIHPGQDAAIKITAYDPSIYGSLKGKVKYISADAIEEEDKNARVQSYYKILVQTNTNHLQFESQELPIIPGMQATVDILTGEKTILQYLLKPFLKAKQGALRER